MSLFVAVRLPDVAVADLAATHGALPPELAATRPELRWVPPQNWHLTLAFLGQVGTERMADLETRLARAAGRRGPLTLWLAGSGHFGTRVLFLGVGGDVERLGQLAASVAAAARRSKVSVDDRPYRPHVTLARVRGTTSLRDLADALASYAGPPWNADAIDLMESMPAAEAGRAPRYVVRRSFSLGRGPG